MRPARRTDCCRRVRQSVWLFILLALTLAVAGGCRRASHQPDAGNITIELERPLFEPAAGPTVLYLRVLDTAGNALDNAAIHARADMIHAGMVPLFVEAGAGRNGLYTLPIEWTMTGDWVVSVEASLPDGRRAARQFDFTVTGEDVYCTSEH